MYFIDFYEIFMSIKAILAKHVCFQCSDWSSARGKPLGTAGRKFPTKWMFLKNSQTFAKTTVFLSRCGPNLYFYKVALRMPATLLKKRL